MEDRHVLSAPRLQQQQPSSNLLVWLVDIYRKGVSDPIDTIEISNETLPPRVNKKGKVVWRLPTDDSRLPSFAVNEQRRIMELFKERKKNRKKKAAAATSGSGDKTVTVAATAEDTNGGGDRKKNVNSNSNVGHSNGEIEYDRGGGKLVMDSAETQMNAFTSAAAVAAAAALASLKKKKKKRDKKAVLRGSTTSIAISGGGSVVERQNGGYSSTNSTTYNQNQQHQQTQGHAHAHAQPLTPTAPPGLNNSIPPPGFRDSFSSMSMSDNDPPENDTIPKNNQSFPSTPPSISMHSKPPDNTHQTSAAMPSPPPPTTSTTAQPPMNHPPAQQALFQRYIVIPEIDRPNPSLQLSTTAKPSLAVAAAKAFVDLYYPRISHGLSTDLATYYTPHAQKSISVGGAHSVVASRLDIMLQLSKFSGSNFVVRGVVSQDTFDNKGAHVLVTGVVQTALTGMTSFAHSISLVRKEEEQHQEQQQLPQLQQQQLNGLYSSSPSNEAEYSFQIHNDALSLLTVSDMISNEQQ